VTSMMKLLLLFFSAHVFCDTSKTMTNMWVSPGGSDNNPGTRARPYQTISHAVSLVNLSPSVINVIHLTSGVFGLNSVFALVPANIQFLGQSGAILSCEGMSGPYVTWNQNKPIEDDTWYTISFSDVFIQNCTEYGIYAAVCVSNEEAMGGVNFEMMGLTSNAPAMFPCAEIRPCNVSVYDSYFGTNANYLSGLSVDNAVGVYVDSVTFSERSEAVTIQNVMTFVMSDSLINNCSSGSSDVLSFVNVDTIMLTESRVTYSYSSNNIMAINTCSFANLSFVSFDHCMAANSGSLISTYDLVQLYMSESQVSFNQFNSGIFLRNTGADLDSLAITSNSGVFNLYLENANVVMTNCQVSNNEMATGGAFFAMAYTKLSASSCTFDSNYASESGGAFCITDVSSVQLQDVTISNNKANTAGAGYCTSGGSLSDPDCSYSNNISLDGSPPLQCE